MTKRSTGLLLIALLCGLSVAGMAWAIFSASYINWDVIAGGGGHVSQGGYTIDGSAGQPAVGTLSGGSYSLAAGFWPGVGAATSTPMATPTPTSTVTNSPLPFATPTATPTSTVTPPTSLIYLPIALKSSS